MDKLASFVLSLLLVFMSSKIVWMEISAHREASRGKLQELAPHSNLDCKRNPAITRLKRVGVDEKVGGSYFKQQAPTVWTPVEEKESPWLVGSPGKINLAFQNSFYSKDYQWVSKT